MKKQTEKTVLVLRTCRADMTSCHGYKWPVKGKVSAPDWRDDFDCGGGLHGWLWGEGDGSLGIWDVGAKWLVVRVLESDIRHGKGELIGKCKFPKGVVVFCGDRKEATDFIAANGAAGKSIVGGTATAGYSGTATAGYSGTATAGDGGTATAGDGGTATAGVNGTATAGDGGTATAGVNGTATAGDGGTATAGDGGTATAGDGGTATAGDGGTATAGDGGTATAGVNGTATAGVGGTATAGYRGTATAGYRGTATAGYSGLICIKYWDAEKERYRIAVGYVGEDGIKPGVKYRLDDNNKFVEAI
jgi:hypothetical protein